MLRRWYVLLALLACTLGYTTMLASTGGVFSTRTVIFFIHTPQNRVDIGPNNGTEDESVIAFAGAVAADINNGRAVVGYAREEAPLYGAGKREGVIVSLSDVGGQWTASFNRAEIVIQIIGPTYDTVQATQQELILKVNETSRELQGDDYENASKRIRAEVLPLTDSIYHVAAGRNQRLAAYAATTLAAIIVAGWLSLLIDRHLSAGARLRHIPSRNKKGRWQ